MTVVYIVWYRRRTDVLDGIYGIYDSFAKACQAEADAKEVDLIAWINKEVVH